MINHKPTIYRIVSVFIVLCIVITADVYLYERIVDKNAQTSAAISAVDELQAEADQAQGIKALYQNTAADRAKLDSYILTQDGVVNFVELVEALGKVNGSKVTVSNLSNQGDSHQEAKTLNTAYLNAYVTVSGSWQQVMQMLSLVENLQVGLKVNSFQVQRSSVDGKKVVWTGIISISVLSYK